MVTVKVPKTPKSSFDKDRRPSALLLDQIKHLEWAVLPAAQRKPNQLAKYKPVKTESQAAERIAQLTTMVLKAKEDVRAPVVEGVLRKIVLPPLPKATGSPTKTSKAKKPKASKRKARPARSGARKARARGKRR